MAVARKVGAKHYLECSAKTGEGVDEVFRYATRAALLTRGKKKKKKNPTWMSAAFAAMFQSIRNFYISDTPDVVNVTNVQRFYGAAQSVCILINRLIRILDLSALERFTSLGALHDSSAQDPSRTCIPGTRQHVIEALQRWFDDPSSERIFWLHGPIGVGKSAIAQTVAHTTDGRDKVAATFFFSRSDPSRNDGCRLFATLAWQLAISIPAIQHHISHALSIP
jgi:hypothetical protein